jgi:hypothetical protein
MPIVKCQICTLVPGPELLELNALLADPDQWAGNALKDWVIPKGALPGQMRKYGGIATAQEWLRAHGFPDITRRMVEHHFKTHVVHIAKTDADTEQLGKMVAQSDPSLAIIPQMRPNLFIDYYSTGIQLGVYALEKLRADIIAMEQAGTEIPHRTLWQMAELGAKLSMSQAAMFARGSKIEESGDEMAGFRAGEAPLPSQKFKDHRIRTIDGEARPVVDRGIGDRKRYNQRAKQEGSPTFDA